LICKRNNICRQLDMTPEESGNLTDVFMIGDNPKSDIEGTNNFKSVNNVYWTSILVETGVWKQGQPDRFPQWISPNVEDDVNGVLRNRGLPMMPG
jgi:ribonucleotide monophosphatase NagD (HAD superfamily)